MPTPLAHTVGDGPPGRPPLVVDDVAEHELRVTRPEVLAAGRSVGS